MICGIVYKGLVTMVSDVRHLGDTLKVDTSVFSGNPVPSPGSVTRTTTLVEGALRGQTERNQVKTGFCSFPSSF